MTKKIQLANSVLINSIRESVNNKYNILSARIDNMTNDDLAIKCLTSLENQQIKDEQIINDFENLVKQFDN